MLSLMKRDYQTEESPDFVCHVGGKEAYFFACPSLGMLTHGFERHVVEKVFRDYVVRCFALIDNRIISGTKEQLIFFEKYKSRYYEKE